MHNSRSKCLEAPTGAQYPCLPPAATLIQRGEGSRAPSGPLSSPLRARRCSRGPSARHTWRYATPPQTSPLQRPAPQGRRRERSARAAGTTVPQDPPAPPGVAWGRALPARGERGSGHNLLPRPASGPAPSRAEQPSAPPGPCLRPRR